jgi:adenosyl cobinamide kinase/adenosyl cobinamide phosphate guanylyltransferase
VECGPNLAKALRSHPAGTVLVDSLGTWLTAHHNFVVDTADLLDALSRRTGLTVVVSEEVGLHIHPASELGRMFVDAIGDLNQAVAAVATDVALVVAGRTVWLPADSAEAGPR